jgi:hypothetical protein
MHDEIGQAIREDLSHLPRRTDEPNAPRFELILFVSNRPGDNFRKLPGIQAEAGKRHALLPDFVELPSEQILGMETLYLTLIKA